MPPDKTNKKYLQKYRKEWEFENQFKDWLKPYKGNDSRAFCSYCHVDMAAHRKGLEEHAATKEHVRNVGHIKDVSNVPKMTNYLSKSITVNRKIAELKISAFIAEHCSIRTVDHLGELLNHLDQSSQTLVNIRLHRTKCTGLILNVLSPCFLEELIADVGDSHFSLIIDESTAVDTKKIMCIMIRYFSKSRGKIHTTFYRLIELQSGTAEHMTNCLTKQVEIDGLKLENLIGIGIDGANSMIGKNNSLSSKLKDLIPHLVPVKCLCHSLHKAAEKACDVLPKNLDFLVKESHGWFSKSTKRNISYSELHNLISVSDPKKIAKLSGTRWLARLNAIETILDQWDSLELHFNTSRYSERADAGFKAETLYQMYRCVENKLYLLFLRDSLKGVVELNKLFQSDSVEPLKLLRDLNDLLYTNLQRIVVPQRLERVPKQNLCAFNFKEHLIPVDSIYYGYYFNELSRKCNPENLLIIKQRCRDFLIQLVEELQMRMPDNMEILEKVSTFTPEVASSAHKEDITDIASFFKTVCIDIDATIREWNFLHRLEIEKCSSDEYWAEVSKSVDAGGAPKFQHISKLALALLSLPFSNASVERAFSLVNIIKNKLRNRMSIVTADAILRVKYALIHTTCTNFQPTERMLNAFNSEQIYESQFQDEILDAIGAVIVE